MLELEARAIIRTACWRPGVPLGQLAGVGGQGYHYEVEVDVVEVVEVAVRRMRRMRRMMRRRSVSGSGIEKTGPSPRGEEK